MILQHCLSFVLFISCLWPQRHSSKKGKKKKTTSIQMFLISGKTLISTRKHSSWLESCLGHTQEPTKAKSQMTKTPQQALCLAKFCFLPMRKPGLEEGRLLTEKMPLIFLELQEHWYNCYYYNSTYKHCWTLGIEILVAVFEALFINACKMLWDLQL